MLEFNETLSPERQTLFIEVILPLAISKTYTYRVPYELNSSVKIGKRVVVQFGKSKLYTAIIYQVSQTPPQLYDAKYILDILDEEPIVTKEQLQLWAWMAEYYLCSMGEVMQAALPAALKLASETRIILSPDHSFDKSSLSDKEYLIIDALEIQSELRVSDINKLLGQKTVFPILKGMFEKGFINILEEISEKYKPRTKAFIKLFDDFNSSDNLKALFDILNRAPKQQDALLAYIKLKKNQPEISKAELLEQSACGESALKGLIDKKVFIIYNKELSRLSTANEDDLQEFNLSAEQQKALVQIEEHFKTKSVVLLHGITSSGKTQLYVRHIEKILEKGGQVLYLLPEIALTTQIIERLRKYFGNKIGVYHSKFNDNERAEVWKKVLTGDYDIILGARSSIFLPFNSLGLIIVDEEHETSFKQFDPAPRYHARDTAIYLARTFGANVLLGSATPSLESYYNTKIGKYGLVELKERFGGVKMPEIKVVSITEETKKQTMQSHFTTVLIDEIRAALMRKEQIILFQNRRGYTPFILCATCGFSPKCINCDVSLTYHKTTGKLHCHYCGYRNEVLHECPACGSARIEQKGFGTEKIEDELKLIFPDIKVARMDLDSTRSRNSFQQLINDFEDNKIDVMVGTQMVAKGLDFSNVSTIGVISADSMLNYPDFRAYERSFQLLLQVAGRAGRRDKQGKVILQAYDINNRVLNQVINHDFNGLFSTEITERKSFNYPPFFRLIQLDIKHKDVNRLEGIVQDLAKILKKQFGDRILGPETPLVGRIRTYYIKTILIKAEKEGVSINKIKNALSGILRSFESDPINKGVYIQIDVDPY
ncbi:MAG TPA: primosomal protein N' [Sphingobacteriaceae bacterium]|nr:primosomal protein N' [Sphingobacteriaceae bacterium]